MKTEKEDLKFIYNHLKASGWDEKRIKVLKKLINKPVETTNERPRFTSNEYHIICNSIRQCHGDKDEVYQINAKMNKLVEN
jgi:hypothetical protein